MRTYRTRKEGIRRDTTEGFFSRWVVVPFSAFFPAGRADPTLIDRLTRPEELQGLLRAAVGGLQQVMRRGAFAIPPSVANATERFKMEADPMRGFIEERIEFLHSNATGFTPRTELYLAYSAWAGINGFHQMSAQRFYEGFTSAAVDVSTHPVVPVTRDGTRGFKGLMVK
jgi:putative DNA primase/helicase